MFLYLIFIFIGSCGCWFLVLFMENVVDYYNKNCYFFKIYIVSRKNVIIIIKILKFFFFKLREKMNKFF